MTYFWHFFKHVLNFKSFPFGIDRWLFSLPKGWKFSIGIWAKYSIDDPLPEPINVTIPTHFPYTAPNTEMKQIRLINLAPGNYHDVLEADFLTCSLLDQPSFEALSYTWGDYLEGEADLAMTINGHEIRTRKNLEDALRALRHHDTPKRLWADAVCIDQYNMHERNHQVRIMDQVYGQAENEAAFLGLASEHSLVGMSVLGFLVDISAPLEDAPWLRHLDKTIKLGIQDIFQRTWFWRIWTIQEAALAKKLTITCGSQNISWICDHGTLSRILFRIKSCALSPEWQSSHATQLRSLGWSPFLNILEMQLRTVALKKKIVIEKNLLDIAFDFRHRHCTDPRDRYYAILGLADKSEGRRFFIQPDYHLSLEGVHNQFTTEIARLHGILGGSHASTGAAGKFAA